jgi:hypothetical protein
LNLRDDVGSGYVSGGDHAKTKLMETSRIHNSVNCYTPLTSAAALSPTPHLLYTLPNNPTLQQNTATMAMETDTIPNLLGDQRDQAPEELQNYFIDFEDYWERKLWHELTDKLIEYFEHPESAKQRIPLFETFIKSFAKKINQLKLVTLGLSAAPQIKGRRLIGTYVALDID